MRDERRANLGFQDHKYRNQYSRNQLFLGLAVFGALAQPAVQNDPWPGLASELFKGRPLADGVGLLAIDMPGRAEDAAIVPLTVRANLAPDDPRRVTAVTIVIDENPAPVAAIFNIGPNAVISSISTRVRVNAYTNVHAVAELSDGQLYVVNTYVKASGGCSAPAAKNADKAGFGRMRFRHSRNPPKRRAARCGKRCGKPRS